MEGGCWPCSKLKQVFLRIGEVMNLKSKHLLSKSIVALGMVLTSVAFQSAHANGHAGWTRSSTVDSQVTNNNNGTWTYNYVLNNTSLNNGGPDAQPLAIDWELPWFGDAGIDVSSILSPNGWAVNIETIGVANSSTGWEGIASWQDPSDAFYAGPASPFTTVTQVLHWYTRFDNCGGECGGVGGGLGVFPGGSLAGFSFIASFAQTDAPYQASWAFLPVRSGDPAFPLGGIPNSPLVGVSAVPEPETYAMMLAGLGLVGFAASRRRKQMA